MEKVSLPKVAALIMAAGSGKRMNASKNKIWLTLNGRSLLEHTLETFQGSGLFDVIVIVANPSEIEELTAFLRESEFPSKSPIWLTAGGKERHHSVANGLFFLDGLEMWNESTERLVAIHDAARALVTTDILTVAITEGWKHRAVGIAVPVKDTIKQSNFEGFVVSTPERSCLWAVQTPQVFDFNLISECYRKISSNQQVFSDDCGVAEYCGYPVKLIKGSYENIKITTPEDLIFAEAILRGRIDADRARV